MTEMRMNPKVDEYLSGEQKWREELKSLRTIVLECGLHEELKWGKPCYTHEKSNVLILHAFKEYCAILFVKGALLKDSNEILIRQTENVQAGRQIRFTSLGEIIDNEPTIKGYIYEAIEIERAGLEVNFKNSAEFAIPGELQNKLDQNPELKAAFYSLTPGRQRGYILYFSQPKQSKTRESRIEKYVQPILDGKGLSD